MATVFPRNQELSRIFRQLATGYAASGDEYRAQAFSNAANNIAVAKEEITSGAGARKNIRGIGTSSVDIIDEYLRTGQVGRLTNIQKLANTQPAINQPTILTPEQNQQLQVSQAREAVLQDFQSYYGIGPVSAQKFYNQGFRTLLDLWNSGQLNDAQRTGILWRDHIVERIPRNELDLIASEIGKRLDPYGIKWVIAGSYRRGELTSGDVDVLVQARPDMVMAHLESMLLADLLAAKLASGPTKYSGILRLGPDYYGRRIDIRLVDPIHWPFALMYFTGSQHFNILMRNEALSQNKSLNEYQLTDLGTNQPIAGILTEEDIFRELDVRYYPPIERTKELAGLERTK